jgi:hypothetical protein
LDIGATATPSAVTGRLFHDEDNNSLWYYDGSDWQDLTVTGAGGGTPGGATYDFQYNAGGGSFGGATNFVYDANGNVTVEAAGVFTASGSAYLQLLGVLCLIQLYQSAAI